jgi:hypothetical protein
MQIRGSAYAGKGAIQVFIEELRLYGNDIIVFEIRDFNSEYDNLSAVIE